MKLEYFELISAGPIRIPGVGSLKPPTLRDVSRLTYPVYETYLAFLSMQPDRYCTEVNTKYREWYEALSPGGAELLSMYDIAVSSEEMIRLFGAIFQFFFAEQVVYDNKKDAFLLLSSSDADKPGSQTALTGAITKGTYTEIVNLILRLNHLDAREKPDLAKAKSEKAKKIYARIQKLKASQAGNTKKNADLDIGNIISSVCARHNSINYTNVWDLTVYQLWDTFHRLQTENAYAINKTMVSVWGDKEKKFDFNSWFKNINSTSNR